nr:MAG TPA: hypothetical protein [Caudoviricetes sp.]
MPPIKHRMRAVRRCLWLVGVTNCDISNRLRAIFWQATADANSHALYMQIVDFLFRVGHRCKPGIFWVQNYCVTLAIKMLKRCLIVNQHRRNLPVFNIGLRSDADQITVLNCRGHRIALTHQCKICFPQRGYAYIPFYVFLCENRSAAGNVTDNGNRLCIRQGYKSFGDSLTFCRFSCGILFHSLPIFPHEAAVAMMLFCQFLKDCIRDSVNSIIWVVIPIVSI